MNAPVAGNVAVALARLEPLLSDERRATALRLRSRLAARQFRVLIVGEAKRGKSTFVNALIGRGVLPMGVLPVTALVTTVTGGSADLVVASYADGRREERALDALPEFVTEAGNPHNSKGVASVSVVVDTPHLFDGLQIADTPGTGSIFEHNTRAAERGLDDVDAAIFVLTADPPISAAEIALFDVVRGRAQFVFFVLNKIDHLEADDVRQVHEFTARALADRTGEAVELYDCSARQALTARRAGDDRAFRRSGMAAFENALRDRVTAARDIALPASIAAHAGRLLDDELDEAALAFRILQLRSADERQRVASFRHALDVAVGRQRELRTLLESGRQQLAEQLTAESERLRRQLLKAVSASLDELVGGDGLAPARPRDLELAGHARAATLIRASIEGWQRDQETVMQAVLVKLAATISTDVNRAIDDVRAAARELLGIDLSLGRTEPHVPASTRFNFDFAEAAGPTELLTGALRRRLPRRIAQRRAISWLGRDSRDLVDRHVGRARADINDRFREACRQLAAQAAAELRSVVASLREAMDRASAVSDDEAARCADAARLDQLIAELRGLSACFANPSPSRPQPHESQGERDDHVPSSVPTDHLPLR